ncbi:hypothetical protein AKO1_015861, partial [Acrasis kona]
MKDICTFKIDGIFDMLKVGTKKTSIVSKSDAVMDDAASTPKAVSKKESNKNIVMKTIGAVGHATSAAVNIIPYVDTRKEELDEDNVDDATKIVEQMSIKLEKDPNNVEALLKRSHAYILLNNYYKALEDAQRGSTLNPSSLDLKLEHGIALFHLQKLSEAESNFDEVIENQSHTPLQLLVALHFRSRSFLHSDQFRKCLVDCSKGIRH